MKLSTIILDTIGSFDQQLKLVAITAKPLLFDRLPDFGQLAACSRDISLDDDHQVDITGAIGVAMGTTSEQNDANRVDWAVVQCFEKCLYWLLKRALGDPRYRVSRVLDPIAVNANESFVSFAASFDEVGCLQYV